MRRLSRSPHGHRTRPQERQCPQQPRLGLDQKGQYGRLSPSSARPWTSTPSTPLPTTTSACALNQKGQYDQAIPILRKAIEVDPKNADCPHQPRQRPERRRGSLTGPSPIYRKAIELDPKNAIAHNNLGTALHDQKGQWTRPSPSSARPSNSTPRTPCPQQPRRRPERRRGSGRGHRRPTARPSNSTPRTPMPTATSANALNEKGQWTGPSPSSARPSNSTPRTPCPHQPRHRPEPEGAVDQGHRHPPQGHRSRPQERHCPQQPRRALNQKGNMRRPSPSSARPSNSTPRIADAHNNLGWALNQKGQYDQGHPHPPQGHRTRPQECRESQLSREYTSRCRTVLGSLNSATFHQSVKPDDLQRQVSDQLVHRAEQIVELDRKLPAILRGEVKLADDSELTMFPEMCQYKTLYATSAILA